MPEVSYLRNPLDEGRQVSSARDGQELSYEVGVELCTHFDVRVYLEDPKTYEPCLDEPLPFSASSPRDALPPNGLPPFQPMQPMPGPPPVAPPPWMTPFGGQLGSPFDPAPAWCTAPGTASMQAAPPGVWTGASGGRHRRRRRSRSRSSSIGPPAPAPVAPAHAPAASLATPGTAAEPLAPAVPAAAPQTQPAGRQGPAGRRERTRRRSREDTPDFTKMSFQEYWWKKTHPMAPVVMANGAAPVAAVPPPGVTAVAPGVAPPGTAPGTVVIAQANGNGNGSVVSESSKKRKEKVLSKVDPKQVPPAEGVAKKSKRKKDAAPLRSEEAPPAGSLGSMQAQAVQAVTAVEKPKKKVKALPVESRDEDDDSTVTAESDLEILEVKAPL
eukprot:symbB.v1.2.023903.t1/scaffold2224.1/size85388/7